MPLFRSPQKITDITGHTEFWLQGRWFSSKIDLYSSYSDYFPPTYLGTYETEEAGQQALTELLEGFRNANSIRR